MTRAQHPVRVPKGPALQVPYHRPSIDSADRAAVARVLRSGWLTTGKEAEAFEREFAEYVGAQAALAVSSCTAALHVALELMNLSPGDEVIVPTLTFTASAGAILMAGLTPVVADIDPTYLTLTADAALSAVTLQTKVLLPVHYGGNPSGFMGLLRFADTYGYRVLDDAAHALPTLVGTGAEKRPHVGGSGLSDATAFSFYPTKPVVAGEGGMLTLRDPALLPRARRLTLHGIDADAYQRSRQAVYHYSVTEHGWKYNLPDLLAALGRTQLRRADQLWGRRRDVADGYDKGLVPLVEQGLLTLPTVELGCVSAWHLYPIRFNLDALREGWTRDRIAAALQAVGVGTSVHYRPLHRHPFWAARFGLDRRAYPHADAAYEQLLSLPIWPDMRRPEVERVVEALTGVLRRAVR